ncbi:MAG: hypothetical protein MJZ10_14115 [Fibrobacter sp.]|nr:hypothetical protein [Fibrobacter sp.]
MPIASMTVVPHGAVEKDVAETMKDLILEELNVREMKFLEDDNRARRVPRPSLLGHGRAEAVGTKCKPFW